MSPTYTFAAKLWMYSGVGAWYFVTLPREYAAEIKLLTSDGHTRGFGSIKVAVTIGSITWKTSIFPDKKSESYLLPVKKDVRVQLKIEEGDMVDICIELESV